MTEIRKLLRQKGVQAGVAVVLGAGAVAMSGVAGAAENATQDETITAVGAATDGIWDKPSVTIQTGDTVTWAFPGTNTHNVASSNTSATDPRWAPFAYKGEFQPVTDGTSASFTFYKAGNYTYVCVFHGGMTGEVVVQGTDLPIPTDPTPTATATNDPNPTPTSSPQPTVSPAPTAAPDDHTNTPPPTPAADRTKPVISSVKLRALKRAARVRFRLSENSTVTLQVRKRGSKRVLRTVRLQARAGNRTVTIRSSKLRKGRYTVTILARDAMGNKATTRRAAVRIRR